MMNDYEKKLLLSIKVIPLLLFTVITVIGIIIAVYINKTTFNNEIKKVKDIYLKNEKEIVKNEVLKVHNNIVNEKKLTREKLKTNIKEKVDIAHTIATNIYNEYKTTKTTQEIKKMIQDALVNIRFNEGRGYFFIYSLNYECILLPVARQFEGKSFYNFKDGKGMHLTREIVKQMKKEKEGFLTWWYHKPADMKKQYEKIGYNKYFEPLNWFIGTGEYVKDFEETIKSSITKRLSTYRYGKDSYIFIFNKDAVTISHPKKNEIGKNKSDYKDSNGLLVTQNIFKLAQKEDGGFIKYSFQRQKDHKETDKISYVMKFKDWDWIIGSGFYTDDLKEIIEIKKKELIELNQQQLDRIIIVSIIFMVLIISLSIALSYTIQKRFENYKFKVKQKDQMISEQSKMAAMGEMLGNIAHQWRQPLSIISTGATGMLAQKEYGLLNDEQFNTTCKAINENAQYLSKTIDDFKNFIKGDRIKKVFNLKENIKSFLHLVEGSIKTHDINLILKVDNSIEVNGYGNELIQCFINIFNNSKDALKENVEKDRIIMISASIKEDHTVIKFTDNGKGIPADILPKIFEPYFTTKHKSQGTGLGLNMTYKFIVDGMKGELIAENKKFVYNNNEYTGAEFTISLPR